MKGTRRPTRDNATHKTNECNSQTKHVGFTQQYQITSETRHHENLCSIHSHGRGAEGRGARLKSSRESRGGASAKDPTGGRAQCHRHAQLHPGTGQAARARVGTKA